MVAVAYHEINGGEVLWKEIFPADLGAPAIAEMNGKTQIGVACQDGYIYGLGQADKPTCFEIRCCHDNTWYGTTIVVCL